MPAHFVYRGSCLGVVLDSEVCTDRSTHEYVRHELLLKRCRASNIMFTQTTNDMIHAIGKKPRTLENNTTRSTNTLAQRAKSQTPCVSSRFRITAYAYHCIWKTMSQHHTVNILYGRHSDTELAEPCRKTNYHNNAYVTNTQPWKTRIQNRDVCQQISKFESWREIHLLPQQPDAGHVLLTSLST